MPAFLTDQPNCPPSTLLRRRDAAAALMREGYPITASTLATKACRGGGPPFRRFGRTVLYRWGDLRSWAEAQLTQPVHSTSEFDAQVP